MAGEPGVRRTSDISYYLFAIVVGSITGVIGTILHLGVNAALQWPRLVHTEVMRLWPELPVWGFLAACGLFAALLVVAATWLVRTFVPEAGGSGVQEVEGAMEGLRVVRWKRVLPVKFVGGLMALGSGLVVGREGPTIHMGASVAQATASWFSLGTRDARGLLASGAAAGLAAAFNAPLAAVLFVIEETRRQFPYGFKTYSAVILASVASGIVTEAITGTRPFMEVVVPETPLSYLPAFVVLGVLLGLLGVLFNRCLVWGLDFSLAVGTRSSFYIVPALVGFAVGILAILRPEATQGGEMLAVTLIENRLPLLVLAGIVLIRFVMTMASYSTGAPGGIFAPILALATATGMLYGVALETVLPDMPAGVAAALAVAAMGGLFSSTVRAPLVGIVLVLELTGAYTLLVPAILTCVFSNIIAEWLGGKPIYEVLLDRTLRLAGQVPPPQVKAVDGSDQIGGWDETVRRPGS